MYVSRKKNMCRKMALNHSVTHRLMDFPHNWCNMSEEIYRLHNFINIQKRLLILSVNSFAFTHIFTGTIHILTSRNCSQRKLCQFMKYYTNLFIENIWVLGCIVFIHFKLIQHILSILIRTCVTTNNNNSKNFWW